MKTTKRLIAAFTIILAFTVSAMAQNTNTDDATIPAAANVAAAISVTGNSDGLNFGIVTPGIHKTVTNTGLILPATAASTTDKLGEFTVVKGEFTQVSLTFELPTSLAGTGSNSLPIEFLTTSARLSDDTENVTFDPNAPFNVVQEGSTLFAYSASTFSVYIGGKVKPTASQTSDAYASTIKLTATYN